MSEITPTTLRSWITRWDRQQEFYLPYREDRYDAMLTVLRHLITAGQLRPDLRLLDLGCGTGSIGQRLLERFPAATYVGVDIDAALLHLARSLEADHEDRFTVLQRDLSLDSWAEGFADGEFDVVASSTALHWLSNEDLERVFGEVHRLLRPGGLFFDADNLAYASSFWQGVSDSIEREQQEVAATQGHEDWDAWWSAMREDPTLAPLVAEHDRRFPPSDDADLTVTEDNPPPPIASYVNALMKAGFTDIEVLWQRMDDRLLAARRPVPGGDAPDTGKSESR